MITFYDHTVCKRTTFYVCTIDLGQSVSDAPSKRSNVRRVSSSHVQPTRDRPSAVTFIDWVTSVASKTQYLFVKDNSIVS